VENKIVERLDFFAQKGASLSESARVDVFQLWNREGRSGKGPLSFRGRAAPILYPTGQGFGQGCETRQSYQLLLGHRNNESSTTGRENSTAQGERNVIRFTIPLSQRSEEAAAASRPP